MNAIGKIVIAGNNYTGKTCLVKTFLSQTEMQSSQKYKITLWVQPSVKSFRIPSIDEPIKLMFLDSSGLDLYQSMLVNYWNKPNMLLLVFDVTSQSSFDNLIQWIELARLTKWDNKFSVGPIAIAIFANKTDIEEKRIVNYETGKEFAKKYQMEYFEGSTRTREGIEEILQWLINKWNEYLLKIK